MLPATSTSQSGLIKMPGVCRLSSEDLDIMSEFINRPDISGELGYSDRTRESYAKEFRRLALYCTLSHKSLNDIDKQDVVTYLNWLNNPPENMVGDRRSVDHPEWKPFASKQLSAGSIKQALAPIKSLWSFMQDEGYVVKNPWKRIRSTSDGVRNEEQLRRLRIIPRSAIETVLAWLDQAVNDEHEDQERIARCRWLFFLYLFSGTRLSDALKHDSQAFEYVEMPVNSTWVFNHRSKGKASHSTPVPDILIEEYDRYLASAKKPPLADTLTPRALMYSIRSYAPITNRLTIHREIKYLFQRAGEFAATAGDTVSSQKLKAASTHWIKHSFVTLALDVSGGDIRSVTDLARHKDWRTTKSYDHTGVAKLAGISHALADAALGKDSK